MSTRANIAFGNKRYKNIGWFYHHFDGYPDGPIPKDLEWLKDKIKKGKVRANAEQSMGWLIAKGCENADNWKASDYEPSLGIHTDIDYLYLVRFNDKELEWKYLHVEFDEDINEYVKEAERWISGEGG